jgi:hypothetical protein
LEWSVRAGEHPPALLGRLAEPAERIEEQQLHGAARPRSPYERPRAPDACVVQDDESAFGHATRPVGDRCMLDGPGVEHQHARTVALGERSRRDGTRGQIVVEELGLQGAET